MDPWVAASILWPYVIWVLCYPLTIYLAYSRGTSGLGWFILSIFITPIITVALILIMYPKEVEHA